MSDEQLEELLELCRNDLQVSWCDFDFDLRIKLHIKNGVLHIKDITGVDDADFNEGGKANALLLSYVRRAISGDTSAFDTDYMSDLIRLQIENEVTANEE